ncbi:hypothetical protein P7K49_020982 [Saguinus oedipus]|uniref:Uncharacterized protein n=1 Tax=Saguinus oedipus TaxID=9490 RepID=A0ABQ9URC1_SAGOE|nr:hypothetical protein P7K49_020982 [Saguinus oedipus]
MLKAVLRGPFSATGLSEGSLLQSSAGVTIFLLSVLSEAVLIGLGYALSFQLDKPKPSGVIHSGEFLCSVLHPLFLPGNPYGLL